MPTIWVPPMAAQEASQEVSDRYNFLSTEQIVETMERQGYVVHGAQQRGHGQHGVHIVRFRHRDIVETPGTVGDSIPEIILKNAHNGRSSAVIRGGVYELVCANGMVIGTDAFMVKVRHDQHDIMDQIVNAAVNIGDKMEEMMDMIGLWRSKYLTDSEKNHLAHCMIEARFPAREWQQYSPEIERVRVARPRRMRQAYDSGWNVFNRIQESLTRGGRQNAPRVRRLPGGVLPGQSGVLNGVQRREFRSARPLTSALSDYEVNVKIWNAGQEALQEIMDG